VEKALPAAERSPLEQLELDPDRRSTANPTIAALLDLESEDPREFRTK
jgi:hypothetical protein